MKCLRLWLFLQAEILGWFVEVMKAKSNFPGNTPFLTDRSVVSLTYAVGSNRNKGLYF